MRLVAMAILGACMAAAALAQEPPLVFAPTWEAEPGPADLVRHYPPGALRENVSGIAIMCCTPQPDRSVACAVNHEWPAGRGFGVASVDASAGYRLSAESYNDLHLRDDRPVRLSMMWAAPILAPEIRESLFRIDRETAHACLEP